MDNKSTIKKLLYLRNIIDSLIDNAITEDALRGKKVDVRKLQSSIDYQIKEIME